jgi:hypothetical protein
VVVRQELVTLEIVVVKESRPHAAGVLAVPFAVHLERYVRYRAALQSRLEVARAQVRLVGADLFHLKAIARGLL